MEKQINPFSSLRRAAGLTLGEVAAYSRINIRAITRSEYGMYTNPLPALVDYWVRRGAISEGQLVTEYEDYQFWKRRYLTGRKLGNLDVNLNSNIHPLRQLRARAGLGLTDFCKAYCLPLDTVQWFEKKWRHQKIIPKGLVNALNQAGYSMDELKKFDEDFNKWRNNQKQVTFS